MQYLQERPLITHTAIICIKSIEGFVSIGSTIKLFDSIDKINFLLCVLKNCTNMHTWAREIF